MFYTYLGDQAMLENRDLLPVRRFDQHSSWYSGNDLRSPWLSSLHAGDGTHADTATGGEKIEEEEETKKTLFCSDL